MTCSERLSAFRAHRHAESHENPYKEVSLTSLPQRKSLIFFCLHSVPILSPFCLRSVSNDRTETKRDNSATKTGDKKLETETIKVSSPEFLRIASK